MNSSLANTALITGASRGLGLALAQVLAGRRLNLIINARGAEALEDACRTFAEHTRVIAIAGDISAASTRQALANAVEAAGGVDVLVNNASILGPSPQPRLLDYPLDVLESVYQANVFAPLALLQSLNHMIKPCGQILN